MSLRVELENSDDNLCFGCAPENPMGLKLKFFREGDRVTTECMPTKWWSGQPGTVNPWIVYAVLIDIVIWTASAILHRVPLMPKTIDMKLGDLSTQRPILGTSWVVRRGGLLAQIRAELRQDGRLSAWLEMETKSVTREEYQKTRPFVELPNSLQGFFEEKF
ncbi:MAG: hypothetical protein ABSF09_09060 [Candidatus Bathyarchaeia archaeon]